MVFGIALLGKFREIYYQTKARNLIDFKVRVSLERNGSWLIHPPRAEQQMEISVYLSARAPTFLSSAEDNKPTNDLPTHTHTHLNQTFPIQFMLNLIVYAEKKTT